jgi:membrane fusion protein (multidrug efflux system)
MNETDTTTAPVTSPVSAPSTPASSRRRNLIALAAAALVVGAAYAAWWAAFEWHYEATDDAYVSGDVVQVTSEEPGTVIAVNVDDTQTVHRGQRVLTLDPADAQIAMSRAEAELARTVRQVRGIFAQAAQLKAQIAERETELSRADADYRRRAGLAAAGAISAEELSHSKDEIAQLRAALAAAREQLNATEARIENTTVQSHPRVLAAEAAVRQAALALRRTRIEAPVDGVVAKRTVQIGQRVAPGAPLMAVVPLHDVWVNANFKEVQLADMRVGQPVTLQADVYGSSITYHGRLAGLSAGSGSSFALLPAQNASGNWIKIVQRVPVRIALDPKELQAHPLRLGLSMDVRIDVRDTSGSLIATRLRDQALPAAPSLGDDPAVQLRIERIIADNSTPPQVATIGGRP